MAANLQFAESLRQPIQRCKLDLLGRVDTGDGIQRISNFFGELEAAVSVLDTKYSHCGGRFSTVQRLVPARGMVARSLQKIHAKIIHRLNTRDLLIHGVEILKWTCRKRCLNEFLNTLCNAQASVNDLGKQIHKLYTR